MAGWQTGKLVKCHFTGKDNVLLFSINRNAYCGLLLYHFCLAGVPNVSAQRWHKIVLKTLNKGKVCWAGIREGDTMRILIMTLLITTLLALPNTSGITYNEITHNINKCNIICMFLSTVISSHFEVKSVISSLYKYCHSVYCTRPVKCSSRILRIFILIYHC